MTTTQVSTNKILRLVTENEALKLLGHSCMFSLTDFLADKPLTLFEIKYISVGMLASKNAFCPQWDDDSSGSKYWKPKLQELVNDQLLFHNPKDGTYTNYESLRS